MSQTHSKLGIAMTASEYAEQWKFDSDAFHQSGIYSWMREQLGTHNIVLEVGCGAGQGTLALAHEQNVVSVEPNLEMAAQTLALLQANGIEAHLTNVLPLSLSHNVTIVTKDIMSIDTEWLNTCVKPNAVTCWLIGAEPARISQHLSKDLSTFSGIEMPQYREAVHRRCYEIGFAAMAAKGVVHIVDRLFLTTWQQRDEARAGLVELHADLAGGAFSVDYADTRFERYSPPFSTSKIQMLSEGDPSGRVTVFGSVKSRLQRIEA